MITKGQDRVGTMKEYLEGLEEGKITDYNNPDCIDCNDCCTMGAALTSKEYKTIKKYLTKDVNGMVLYKRAKRIINEYLKKNIMYFKCPLSLDSKKCGIYRIRPEVCRDFHCKPILNKIDDTDIDNKEKFKYIIANLFE